MSEFRVSFIRTSFSITVFIHGLREITLTCYKKKKSKWSTEQYNSTAQKMQMIVFGSQHSTVIDELPLPLEKKRH